MTAEPARDGKLFASPGWGERMRLALLRTDLTLEDVGRHLGITAGAISQWLSEKTFPSRRNMEGFARIVAVDTTWLQYGLSLNRRYERGVKHVPMRNPWAPGQDAIPDVSIEIEARMRCSDSAFAIEAFGGFPGSDVKAGDILIIDPEVKPEPMDMVLVVMDDGKPMLEPYFPQNALTVLMKRFLDEVDAQIGDTGATSRRVHGIVRQFRSEQVPLGAQAIGSDVASYEVASGNRIVGVVVEHTRGRYGKSYPHEKLTPCAKGS